MSEQGSTPRDHGPAEPDHASDRPDTAPEVEAGLTDLRARLDELQQSVELLGSQGHWPEPPLQGPPPGPPPGATEYSYGPPGPDPAEFGTAPAYQQPYPEGSYPSEPSIAPPPPEHWPPPGPPTQPPEMPPGAFAPGPAPPQPAPWEQPLEEPLTYPAPPVATNGHSTDAAEISARSANVAIVDAGPFSDLIDLRHFEDDLSTLSAVREVRVRRFGQGRANIEVGMTGPYVLARELYRLGRPMQISGGPDGEVVIDLAHQAEPQAEDEPGAAPAQG